MIEIVQQILYQRMLCMLASLGNYYPGVHFFKKFLGGVLKNLLY